MGQADVEDEPIEPSLADMFDLLQHPIFMPVHLGPRSFASEADASGVRFLCDRMSEGYVLHCGLGLLAEVLGLQGLRAARRPRRCLRTGVTA